MSGEGSNASGLCITGGRVSTLRSPDERQFERSITLARTGVRGLLNLATQGATRTTVAVVPLGLPADDDDALLIFAKRQLCDSSAMALFARACELTAAECNVLASVCTGLRPHEVARSHGVQVSTVRSQLRSIRQKTRSKTVRELVETVSLLPPIARHLA
jgi:DNA-binding CsgD family transcriptional regulator